MKKTMCLLMMIFTVCIFTVSAFAEDIPARTMTAEEFQLYLDVQNNSQTIAPRIITCCDGAPRLVWIGKEMWHITDTTGICVSHAYFGDQICSKCGSVWQMGICYQQTNGCGMQVGTQVR